MEAWPWRALHFLEQDGVLTFLELGKVLLVLLYSPLGVAQAGFVRLVQVVVQTTSCEVAIGKHGKIELGKVIWLVGEI